MGFAERRRPICWIEGHERVRRRGEAVIVEEPLVRSVAPKEGLHNLRQRGAPFFHVDEDPWAPQAFPADLPIGEALQLRREVGAGLPAAKFVSTPRVAMGGRSKGSYSSDITEHVESAHE